MRYRPLLCGLRTGLPPPSLATSVVRGMSSAATAAAAAGNPGLSSQAARGIMSKSKPRPLPATFTRADLDYIREHLLPPPPEFAALPPHTKGSPERPPRESGVLLPFCNVAGQATLIMQVRAAALRVHASEAGFPGGKVEPGDENLVMTALRESSEELAIKPENVEILGSLPTMYSLGNKARVWPIVGFVHPHDALTSATDDALGPPDAPLESINLSSLHPDPGEVAAILPLPLSAVDDPTRKVPHYFRSDSQRPYWKIRVGDLLHPPPDENDEHMCNLEIWGLSGWFLSRLALRMGWSDVPPKAEAEGD